MRPTPRPMPTRPRAPWWREFRHELLIVVIGILAMNAIFISVAFRDGYSVDREAAGQLGDFVGGYVGTLFILISVVLVVATLRSQQTSAAHDNFENRYFELLKLHRD